jgi:acetamidase/formamidase
VDIKKGVHCMVAKDPASPRPIPPRPVAQTAEYLVTTARGSDLNKAMDEASWAMIEFLQKTKGLPRLDAYSLASLTMDCRIGEMTAPEKSVHCVVPKDLWVQR